MGQWLFVARVCCPLQGSQQDGSWAMAAMAPWESRRGMGTTKYGVHKSLEGHGPMSTAACAGRAATLGPCSRLSSGQSQTHPVAVFGFCGLAADPVHCKWQVGALEVGPCQSRQHMNTKSSPIFPLLLRQVDTHTIHYTTPSPSFSFLLLSLSFHHH